jgi:hypothetical protein
VVGLGGYVGPGGDGGSARGRNPDDMSQDAPPSPLPAELRHHCLSQFVRVELAVTGKLHDSNRYKFGNRQCLGTGQPHSRADLLERVMHRVDLVRAKERRAAASAVDCFAQLGNSLRGSPLVH